MQDLRNSTGSAFQTFSTLLALLLPVIQVFFSFLPKESKNIFLIQDYLFVVSVIAGIISYVLIIAFKNTSYFQVTLSFTKQKRYTEFLAKTDVNTNDEKDIKKALKNPQARPFYITPHNIYYALIPTLTIFLLTFLGLGIAYASTENKVLQLIQAFCYIFSVALTSLTLAVFYINESNRLNYEFKEANKYRKVIELLIANDAMPNYPSIEFLAQKSEGFDNVLTYIFINKTQVYEITTNADINSLKQVILYNPPPAQQVNDQKTENTINVES